MTIDPRNVHSPKDRWRLIKVLYDGGPTDDDHRGWSVAAGTWDGKPVLGVRWNGREDEYTKGTPVAMSYPVWFIVPEELKKSILDGVQHAILMDEIWD